MRITYKDLAEHLKEGDSLGDLCADGRILLGQILKK
jgi:hypothetical protein